MCMIINIHELSCNHVDMCVCTQLHRCINIHIFKFALLVYVRTGTVGV